jgi:enterobactin synthetase component D
VSRAREILAMQTPHGHVRGVHLDEACDALEHLHDDERALATQTPESIRRGFVGGRLAMRSALVAAGAPAAPTLRDARGAPLVPPGFSGSISHKPAVAVALACASNDARVGVDVEIEREGRVDISRRVLTDAELAELESDAREIAEPANASSLRAHWTLERFSMKEAIYKAIDPFVQRYVGFREVRLVSAGDAFDCVFVAPRANEPKLVVRATIARVETDLGPLLLSTAIASRG